MNAAEQELLDYLKARLDRQIPYVVIQDELKVRVHSIYQRGMRDAADIVMEHRNIPITTTGFALFELQKAILTAANKL